MRKLWAMAKGAWNHTALLASLLAAPYSDEDSGPCTVADFHPFLPSTPQESTLAPYDPNVLERLQNSNPPVS